MTSADSARVDKSFVASALASFIRIGAVFLLIWWCFDIVRPFVGVMVWGLIIAVALYPLHLSLAEKLGDRDKLSRTLLVLAGLAIIVAPAWLLAESTIDGFRYVSTEFRDGTVSIPPPSDSVADWPVIGKRVHRVWSDAAGNFEETLGHFRPQLAAIGEKAVGFAGGAAVGVLQFIFAMIIAGVLLGQGTGGFDLTRNIANSLAGTESGEKLAMLSIGTIRSVVKGVLGVAIIQTLLAAIGLVAIGVPGAGLFAGIVLVLAIVQLPPILVLAPIAVWYFSVAEAVPAMIFLVYAMIVSVSDAFLKPMLLGRGVETPMLVILIGAIGGAISQGIVGLFVGAVVLAVGYELFIAWITPDDERAEAVQPASD